MVEYLPLKGPRYRARLGPYHSVPPLLCATFLVADFTVRRMTVAMRRCTHQRREECRSAKISHNVRRYNRERWDALPDGSAKTHGHRRCQPLARVHEAIAVITMFQSVPGAGRTGPAERLATTPERRVVVSPMKAVDCMMLCLGKSCRERLAVEIEGYV